MVRYGIFYICIVFALFVYCGMFIRESHKKNTKTGKSFKQYNLVANYRIGKKTKQKYILYLGYDKLLEIKANRDILADLLENKINGNVAISDEMINAPKELIDLSDHFYQKYLYKNRSKEEIEKENKEYEARFETVDTESTKVIDCREIGAESISKNMLDRIGLQDFLRKKGWVIYNMVREVESTLRCLKTDMNLRPVYHQSDENVEAHLHLGFLAYNIVAPIRYQLKQRGIHKDWRNIVLSMNTQKVCTVSQKTRDNKTITIRTCSQPTNEVMTIYRSLNMSSMPLARTKFVVPHARPHPIE